jgi:HK97 family phage portal protein
VSLFRRAAVEERGVIWPGYPYPPSQFSGRTTAGVNVTLDTYTRNAASWACVRVLVAEVKKLPIDVVRYVDDTRIPMSTPPSIVSSPSALVSRRGWVAQWMRSFCSAGNVYGEITAFQTGTRRPLTIELLDPSRATWQIIAGEWKCHIDGKPRDIWPHGDLWHKPATDFLPPGRPYALSPVKEASTSIGTGIAAENFGAEFFGDGAHPTQVLKSSDPNLTSEQAEAAKDALVASTRGNRRPLALGAAWDLEKNFVDPKDSQFIDLLRFEVEQACRWWGVPPSMVYAAVSGQNVTYSNVTQADLAFLKHSIDNWLVDIEDAWSEMIPAPQMVKFNTSALLRMDESARWDIHDLRLKNKTTSVNRVLKIEDEKPFDDPEFDKPGIPGGPETEAKPAKVEPPADDGSTAPVATPAKRSEEREQVFITPNVTANVYMAEQHIDARSDVHMPEARDIVIPAPTVTVNVEPTPVQIDVAAPNVTNEVVPAEVRVDNTVNVPQPQVTVDAPVTVNLPPETERPVVFKVGRDSTGKITKVTEE